MGADASSSALNQVIPLSTLTCFSNGLHSGPASAFTETNNAAATLGPQSNFLTLFIGLELRFHNEEVCKIFDLRYFFGLHVSRMLYCSV